MMSEMPVRDEASWTYPGWRVVAVCFVLAIFAWGFGFYGQSVYVAKLAETRGWPIATVAGAATTYYLASAILVAFAGDAIGRFGARPVIGVGILFLAAGAVATGQATTLPRLYGAYLLLACGWATTSIAAITSAVGGWFGVKRGLAISLALTGASTGGIVGAPALLWASERLGFAEALMGGAVLTILVLGPLLLFVWPAEIRPRGAAAEARSLGRSGRWLALRSRRFWTMTFAFASGLFVQVGFVVHQVALTAPIAGAEGAGLAVGLTAIAAFVGRLAVGTVVDRVDARVVTALSLASQIAGLVIVASASGFPQLLAGSILFGLSVGNLITLPSLIVHREFEPAAFAAIVSLSTAIGQFTYAFGPGAIGWLRDLTGGCATPLLIGAAIDALAAGLILGGRRQTR